jgi:hypothetical protein
MHKYLAWIVYLFGVLGGDATVAVYYAMVVGWDGLPAITGALFCTAVGVVPTLASARGKTINFKAFNTILAFALAGACVFAGITAFRLIRGLKYSETVLARDKERGQQVKEAATEAKAKGLRSRDAADVAKSVASVVKAENQTDQPSREEVLKEPVWFPFFPWVAGFVCAALTTVLLARFWKDEDLNNDGTPDFLQSQEPAQTPGK